MLNRFPIRPYRLAALLLVAGAATAQDTTITFDPRSNALPAGWGGTGADDPAAGDPVLPSSVTFAQMLSQVNETSLSSTIPYQATPAHDLELRIDNRRSVRGGAPIEPPDYEIIDLGTFGGQLASAHAINDAGAVVGTAMDPSFEELPFIWRDGVMEDLGSLLPSGRGHGIARGISNGGHVTGYSMAPMPGFPFASLAQAFFWTEEGGMIPLFPGAENPSYAWDVNASGQVVGQSAGAFLWSQADGMTRILRPNGTSAGVAEGISENGLVTGYGGSVSGAWTYDSREGTFRELMALDTPASAETRDINSAGTVVGWSRLVGVGSRSVRWLGDGTIEDLGDFHPDYPTGVANAINEAGWIVGRDDFNDFSPTPNRGWLWIDGQKFDLKSLIADTMAAASWDELAHPLDVNNRGEIVGIGILNGTPGRAFLMRPISSERIFANGFE